ncbi:MAG: RES domain-containing protein [Acidimicrobiales bacterium]
MAAPKSGLWRIGNRTNPLGYGRGRRSDDGKPADHRWDSPDGAYGTAYLASSITGALGEALGFAPFRPALDPRMAGITMSPLTEADWHRWCESRAAIQVPMPAVARFLDIEAIETRRCIRDALGATLAALGVKDLDVAAVRGPSREVTQAISSWVHAQWGPEGWLYAGIAYQSRLRSGWRCWAVFDRLSLAPDPIQRPIDSLPQARGVARLLGIELP